MLKKFYEAEAYTTEQIIQMLRSQGLEIEDESRAVQVLDNVSYARLKNYLTALMEDRKTHRFRPGSTFEKAYALYGFDRRLRELIFHEMEKIEISIRTRVAFASNGREKGYWYVNPAHFKSEKEHAYILKHIGSELARSDNEGILAFRKKYTNEFPPSWLALEAASMGTVWTIFNEIRDDGLRENIAGWYGMSPQTFSSWLKHLVWVRNSCAHHNRVWNATPAVRAALPEGLTRPFPPFHDEACYHIYFTLCIIKYFQNAVKPTNSFGYRLKTLVGNFKMVDPALMGFPAGWENQEFWK